MPHEKLKTENYSSLGGINNKTSQYNNGPSEFLNLKNLDFQTPYDLTQRWGSTAYVGQTIAGGKITGLFEYTQVQGGSYIVATGSTFGYYVTGDSLTIMARGYTTGYSQLTGSTVFSASFFVNGASLNYDFQVMNNTLYATDGYDFWKWNGQSNFFFGMASPQEFATGYTSGGSGVANGFSGTFQYAYGFVNYNGTRGPAHLARISGFGEIAVAGATFIDVLFGNGPKIPFGYGITSVAIYSKGPLSLTGAGGSVDPIEQDAYTFSGYEFRGLMSLGATFFRDIPGITSADGSFYNQILDYTRYDYGFLPPSGMSLAQMGKIPTFMENFSELLWIGGLSQIPSTVYYSDDSEPEVFPIDNFIEVRTDDGSAVSALKTYNSCLYIFKETSFHEVRGDDKENFAVRMISREYGCVGNRAVCEYQNQMLFLDRKGIIQFNGANINLISSKVDPIFKRMNLSAARDNSCMTYDKLRNQIICDIPVDGSIQANLSIVWDILADAWTTYDYPSYKPAVTTIARGRMDNFYTLIGSYSGLIANFGPSFLTDNGVGYTLMIDSRFHHDLGQSITKQFRRLFLNFDPVGATIPIQVDFHKDYGSSTVLGLTTFESPFQSRLEFGIPAKSLAFTLYRFSLTEKFVFHGYTLAYRFQRNV